MAKQRNPKRQAKRNKPSIPLRERCQPFIRFFFPMLLAGIVVGFSLWGWHQLTKPGALPFQHIKIETAQIHLQNQAVENIAWQNLEGGFFSLNVKKLKQALESLPWVAKVSLQRHWPSTLGITIEEQKPLARWEKNSIISQDGDIFTPNENTIPNKATPCSDKLSIKVKNDSRNFEKFPA